MKSISLSPMFKLNRPQNVFYRMPGSVFFLLIIVVFIACSPEKKDGQVIAPIPVGVGKVRMVEDFQSVSVSGSVVSPCAPSMVSFLVSGRVAKSGPREGDYIKEGQFLASLDPVDYRLAVKAVAAQAEQARVAFHRSEDEYGRMKYLFESKSLAPNDFQKFKAAYDASRQQLEQATANEQLARKRLADTVLYSPVSGFIARRSAEPGEMVAPGRPVFEIVCMDPIEVSVGIPETDIQLVRIAQKATITLPALPDKSFEGVIRVINISADQGTRSYMTRITVPNPGHVLRVGMIAEARIGCKQKIKLITIPGDAIVRDPQGATMVFVYYPDLKRVHSRRVEVGAVHDRYVEIAKGLTGDEQIVIAGQDRVREGSTVLLSTGGVSGGINPGRK